MLALFWICLRWNLRRSGELFSAISTAAAPEFPADFTKTKICCTEMLIHLVIYCTSDGLRTLRIHIPFCSAGAGNLFCKGNFMDSSL